MSLSVRRLFGSIANNSLTSSVHEGYEIYLFLITGPFYMPPFLWLEIATNRMNERCCGNFARWPNISATPVRPEREQTRNAAGYPPDSRRISSQAVRFPFAVAKQQPVA